MSLRSQIATASRQAFAESDSLMVEATYRSIGPTSSDVFDPVTDAITTVDQTATFRTLISLIQEKELERLGLQPQDRKAIFERRNFPFLPQVEDTITVATGENAGTWEVVSVLGESAQVGYVLAIRRP